VSLVEELRAILKHVRILPRRLSLDTPGVEATVPLLRGVWGAAVHDLDFQAYRAVFSGDGPAHEQTPAYVLRPAPPDPEDAPAIEWILIAQGVEYDAKLLRAWDIASGMGLGPQRQRFHIRAIRGLGPDGVAIPPKRVSKGWLLAEASWPISGDPASTSCRLGFPAPLRLIRNGRLIPAPNLPDLTVAIIRRLLPYLPVDHREHLMKLRPKVLDMARRILSEEWKGGRLDLARYSGRQKRGLEMRGVAGHLDLPDGPGELWPLLAAAEWLHLGKGTIVGMGQLLVEPL